MSDKLNELLSNSWSYPVMAEGGDGDGDGRLDPHKMLVTDGKGKRVWQDRLAYTVVSEQEIIPLQTRTGTSIYLTNSMTVDPQTGDIFIVEINGEKHECVAKYQDMMGFYYLGNISISIPDFEDTGESFVVMGLKVGWQVTANFKVYDTYSIRVYGMIEENTPIPAKYLPGGIKSGTGINSLAVNDVPSENVTAPNSFAANSGKAKQTNAFAVNTGEASGYSSFASGDQTFANGDYSFSSGFSTIAKGRSQHVIGKSNIEDTENKYAHIVGNGANALERSNAYTLDWNGNAWFAGGLKVGGTGQDDEAAQEVALKSDLPPSEGKWELLQTTTLSSDASRVEYNASSDKLIAAKVKVSTLGRSGLDTYTVSAQYNLNDSGSINVISRNANGISDTDGATTFTVFGTMYRDRGVWEVTQSAYATSKHSSMMPTKACFGTFDNTLTKDTTTYPYILEIRVYAPGSTGILPANSIIEIYGVRESN